MATLFPSNIDVPQTNVDNVDAVLASDVNSVQDSANAAQVAIGANPLTISDGVAGNPLTAPNVLGGYNGVIGNYPTAGANGTQVGFASVAATMLKRILGAGSANWRTSPVIDLTQIRNLAAITNGDLTATLPNSLEVDSVINAGALGSRPAAASTNAGWLYVITSGGSSTEPNYSVWRSNGSAWVGMGFFPQGGAFAQGDILRFNASSGFWEKLGAIS